MQKDQTSAIIFIREYLQAVVDAVDNVVSRRCLGGKAALVLLDDFLFLGGQSWDVVDICDGVVGAVGGDLAGGSRVHTGHLEVYTDVGIVDINSLTSTKETDVFVVTNGVGSHGGKGNTGGGSSSGEELTTLGVQGSGSALLGARGHKGGDSAVDASRKRDRERGIIIQGLDSEFHWLLCTSRDSWE